MGLIQDIYDFTLEAFKDDISGRFCFETTIKLGKLLVDRKDFDGLEEIVTKLYESCKVSCARQI